MTRTRWLVTAAAGLAAVLGGGAALAAGGSSDPRSDFLGDVAQRLGISRDKLEGAIEDATIARIDAAVADGKLTKEQGEELKKRIRSGDGPVILPGLRGPELGIGPLGIGPPGPPEKGFRFHGPRLGIGPVGPPPGKGFPGFFPGFDFMKKAADYLGLGAADLRKALRNGKSLADVAKDRGKSVDGLEEALRDSIRANADKAVDDGKLTKEQAERLTEKLGSHVDELVEGRPFELHFRARPGRLPLPDAPALPGA